MNAIYTPNFELSNDLIKKLTQAATKEGRLAALAIPLTTKLDISYLANVDAVHFSTKLEGNLLTHKQVTDVLKGKSANISSGRDLKEVLNYSKARADLLEKSNSQADLNKALVLNTHKILLSGIMTGKLKGYYRDSQNVIKDAKAGKIIYLPPEAPDVAQLMQSLFVWVKKSLLDDLSPYIVAAVFHYYFVTIHPFLDGNGRSARLLTAYILRANNIFLPDYAALEKQHEQNRAQYYLELGSLQGVTFYDTPKNINITSWINYWLECLLKTYDEALERCEGPRQEASHIFLNHRLQKAAGLFKKHKQLKASEYELLMGLGRTQAVDDLNQLIAEKVIFKQGGGRSQLYILSA